MSEKPPDDDDATKRILAKDDRRRQRMRWIMERFDKMGRRRRNIFSIDEAIDWWSTFKPTSMKDDTD